MRPRIILAGNSLIRDYAAKLAHMNRPALTDVLTVGIAFTLFSLFALSCEMAGAAAALGAVAYIVIAHCP